MHTLCSSIFFLRMRDVPEMSLQDQLNFANILITALQHQNASYEMIIPQYQQRHMMMRDIIRLQKESIAFLENLLNRVEGVYQIKIDKEKREVERLQAQLVLERQRKNVKTD